ALCLAVRPQTRSMLLRGYIAGLLTGSPKHVVRINEILDFLEMEDAPVAAEIIQGALELTDPATRIVRMVRTRLGFEAMHLLLYGETLNRISSEQFGDLLSVF